MTNDPTMETDPRARSEFRRGAFWLPALLLAVVGAALLLLLADAWGSWGYGAVVGVPFAVGCLLGYGMHVRKLVLVLVVLLVLGGLVGGAVTAELAGLLCGVILLGVVIGPALVGLAVGVILRRRLRRSGFSQRDFLPTILLLVALGGIVHWEAGLVGGMPAEAVRTSRVLFTEPHEVWKGIVFYEEVRHAPPALARIGLPRPLYTHGEISGEGDVKRCVYDKGWLVKRMTEYQPATRLAFDVIEQQGIEDRSVRLIRGSFELERIGPGRTRVTLTTVYEPLLSARLLWRPFEVRLARALHEHVLTGIERELPRVDPTLIARGTP